MTIEAWRGGFKRRGEKYEDGSASPGRRFVLTLYAGFLRGARETPETTTTALRAMAANMRPLYPSDPPGEDPPIESIVQTEFASKTRRWGNEKLCKLLRITAAEARDLELQTIRPPAGTSVENKLTVILPPGQVDFLDRLSLDIRSKTKAKVKRTEIIRALIAGLMGSGLALSGFDSEETIAAAIAERKKGFFSRP